MSQHTIRKPASKKSAAIHPLHTSQDFNKVDFVERQADKQARQLVSMVQGTMGLEAQAVDPEFLTVMLQKTRRRLLEMPKKRWLYSFRSQAKPQ
jgi:hypothetical protein